MKANKLYNPIKNNTFIMMFGFNPPTQIKYKRIWTK